MPPAGASKQHSHAACPTPGSEPKGWCPFDIRDAGTRPWASWLTDSARRDLMFGPVPGIPDSGSGLNSPSPSSGLLEARNSGFQSGRSGATTADIVVAVGRIVVVPVGRTQVVVVVVPRAPAQGWLLPALSPLAKEASASIFLLKRNVSPHTAWATQLRTDRPTCSSASNPRE